MSVCAARFHACERVLVFVCVCNWAMEGHMNQITGLSVAPNGQARCRFRRVGRIDEDLVLVYASVGPTTQRAEIDTGHQAVPSVGRKQGGASL